MGKEHRPGACVRRLEPEHLLQDHHRGVLAAGPAPSDGVHPAARGRRSTPAVDSGDAGDGCGSTPPQVLERVSEHGDRFEPLLTTRQRLPKLT